MSAVPMGATVPVAVSSLHALPAISEDSSRLRAVPSHARSREMAREVGERAREDRWLGFALTGATGAAYDDLHHALLLVKERGREVPCQGPDAAAWTSEELADQERAEDGCLDCPAMILCGAYADLAHENTGTWGGKTRGQNDAERRRSIRREANERKRAGRRVRSRARVPYPGSGCRCGCGGVPKRGTYLSGDDSVHIKALCAAVESGALSADEALVEVSHSSGLQRKLRKQLGI